MDHLSSTFKSPYISSDLQQVSCLPSTRLPIHLVAQALNSPTTKQSTKRSTNCEHAHDSQRLTTRHFMAEYITYWAATTSDKWILMTMSRDINFSSATGPESFWCSGPCPYQFVTKLLLWPKVFLLDSGTYERLKQWILLHLPPCS